MSREEAERVLGAAIETAQQGVDGAECSLVGGTLGVTRFADNEVHQGTQVSREVLSIRVIVGDRAARAETSDITMTGLKIAARQARMMAELMPKPIEPVTLSAPQNYRAADDYDADTERATPLDRMALVGRTIMQAHKEGLRASGYVSTSFGGLEIGGEIDKPYAIANTRGLFAYHAGTRASMSVTMQKKGGLSGWADGQAFALGALDAPRIVARAIAKARVQGEPRELTPGPFTVILEPAAVAGLIGSIGHNVGASDVASGRSFMSGRIGEKVSGPQIIISDDVTDLLHRGTPFDSEGVSKKKVVLIENGIAKGPVHSLASARRQGAEPTGHMRQSGIFGDGEGAEHLVMSGGDQTLETLIKTTPRAILITRLWYVRVVDTKKLIVTGVTRDGTFLVEDGRIVMPVRDMRFNVDVLDLLERVDAMSDVEWASGAVVPGIRANGFPLVAVVPGSTA